MFNDPAPPTGGRTTTLTLASFLDLLRRGRGRRQRLRRVRAPPTPTPTRPSASATTPRPEARSQVSRWVQDLATSSPPSASPWPTSSTSSPATWPTSAPPAASRSGPPRATVPPSSSTWTGAHARTSGTRPWSTPSAASASPRRRPTDLGLGYDDGTVEAGNSVLSRALYQDAPRLVVPFLDFDGHPHYLQARALHAEGVRAKWSGPATPRGPPGASTASSPAAPAGPRSSSPKDPATPSPRPPSATTPSSSGGRPRHQRRSRRRAGRRAQPAAASSSPATTTPPGPSSPATWPRPSRTADGRPPLTIPDSGQRHLRVAGAGRHRLRPGLHPGRRGRPALRQRPDHGGGDRQDITRLFSDVYNAKTLLSVIQEQGGDVRFTTEAGFIVYRPGERAPGSRTWRSGPAPRLRPSPPASSAPSWTRCRHGRPRRRASTTRTSARPPATSWTPSGGRPRLRSLVSYVMSTRGIDSMIRELRALPGVFASYEDFDQHPHLLAVANGVVNLETGELAPYAQETKGLLLLRRVNDPYIPGARNPRWERFLSEVFERPRRRPGLHATPHRLRHHRPHDGAGPRRLLRRRAPTARASSSRPSPASSRASPSPPRSPPSSKSPPAASPTTSPPSRAPAWSWPPRASRADRWRSRSSSASREETPSPPASCERSSSSFSPTFLIFLATNYKPNFRGPGLRPLAAGPAGPLQPAPSPRRPGRYLTTSSSAAASPPPPTSTARTTGTAPRASSPGPWRAPSRGPATASRPRRSSPATAEFKETSDALKRLL